MEPIQPQPTMSPNPLPPANQPKPQPNTKIWIAVGVFVLILSVLITYQSQQSKMERLNQQIASLKTEVKALGGTVSQKTPSVEDNIPIASDIQSKARDSKRQTDISALQTQLEVFYVNNGYYPSHSNMNNPAWLNANMKTLDQYSLADPSNPTGSKTLAVSPTANFYSYDVKNANGNDCEADSTTCAKYTLTATFENDLNGSKTITKSNLD